MWKFIVVFIVMLHSTSQARVIELYTSQGCSSCPPAEEWIGKLRQHPGFMKDIIPMVWHVDYWDRLGWKDTLAKPEYTERQRRYSSKWKASNVYTPGIVVDGEEKRSWRDLANATPDKSARLKISRIKNSISVDLKPSKTQSLWMAILSDGPVIPIKSGENSGRKLLQDFVVTSLQKGSEKEGQISWDVETHRGHAVIWLEEQDDPTPRMASAIKL